MGNNISGKSNAVGNKGKVTYLTDNHSPEERRYNMSQIRSVSNPEEQVRKYLFSKGYRYRKNDKRLPGKPDIVMKKYNTVIFVNGCFWHKHDCGRFRWPASNQNYWENKINNNVNRDKNNQQLLLEQGWNVLIVWECELNKKNFDQTMQQLEQKIVLGRGNNG